VNKTAERGGGGRRGGRGGGGIEEAPAIRPPRLLQPRRRQ